MAKFICPICGGKSYSQCYYKDSNSIIGGSGYATIFYCCDKCSVMFEDPEKFTKKIVKETVSNKKQRSSKTRPEILSTRFTHEELERRFTI